jgi:hypothetical protein
MILKTRFLQVGLRVIIINKVQQKCLFYILNRRKKVSL